MLHNICISAVAVSLKGASRGPWLSASSAEELVVNVNATIQRPMSRFFINIQ